MLKRSCMAFCLAGVAILNFLMSPSLVDGQTKETEAVSIEQAELDLHESPAHAKEVRTAQNSTYAGVYNTTSKSKYRVTMQYYFKGGALPRFFTSSKWREVESGEYDFEDISALGRQITRCRFWWKDQDSLVAPWKRTDWVDAQAGHFMYYVLCYWHDDTADISHYDLPISTSTESSRSTAKQ